jgi:hypothetical protein
MMLGIKLQVEDLDVARPELRCELDARGVRAIRAGHGPEMIRTPEVDPLPADVGERIRRRGLVGPSDEVRHLVGVAVPLPEQGPHLQDVRLEPEQDAFARGRIIAREENAIPARDHPRSVGPGCLARPTAELDEVLFGGEQAMVEPEVGVESVPIQVHGRKTERRATGDDRTLRERDQAAPDLGRDRVTSGDQHRLDGPADRPVHVQLEGTGPGLRRERYCPRGAEGNQTAIPRAVRAGSGQATPLADEVPLLDAEQLLWLRQVVPRDLDA